MLDPIFREVDTPLPSGANDVIDLRFGGSALITGLSVISEDSTVRVIGKFDDFDAPDGVIELFDKNGGSLDIIQNVSESIYVPQNAKLALRYADTGSTTSTIHANITGVRYLG